MIHHPTLRTKLDVSCDRASARIYHCRPFTVIDIQELARTKTLWTTHPFLHSFVSSFLIPPPGVTSPRGGSSDRGLKRGYFTRAAKRVPEKRRTKLLRWKSFCVTDSLKEYENWKRIFNRVVLIGRVSNNSLHLSIKFLTYSTLALLSFLHIFSIHRKVP